jgi:hypothetical protein
MATFNIVGNGTAPAQVQATVSTALFIGGVFGGAKVRVEVSPDGALWAGISSSQEMRGAGHDQPSVGSCMIPSGWSVRTVTTDASPTTVIKVVLA